MYTLSLVFVSFVYFLRQLCYAVQTGVKPRGSVLLPPQLLQKGRQVCASAQTFFPVLNSL